MDPRTPLALSWLLVGPVSAQASSEVADAPASLPELSEPFLVLADGEPIACGVGHAAPFVVDFDGDGLQDLAVGQFRPGTCRLFRNVGTAENPAFGAPTVLRSGGVPAQMESG